MMHPFPMPKESFKLLKEKELAEILSVSTRTVRRLRNRRILPFFKLAPGLIRFCPTQCARALSQYEVKSLGDRESVSLADGPSAFKSTKVPHIKPKATHALPKPSRPHKSLTNAVKKIRPSQQETCKTHNGKNPFGNSETHTPLAHGGCVLKPVSLG